MAYQNTEIKKPSGLNKDLSPFELPPSLWSDGENINFRRNRTQKTKGYANTFSLTDTVAPPLFVIYYTNEIDNLWMYASETAIYSTNGVLALEFATGFNASREYNWNGVNFNNRLIMNNKNDHPQQLNDAGDAVVDLENWGTTKGGDPNGAPWGDASKCKVIRSYKNYLIAMDCYDETGNRFSNMVRWSSPAEAGAVPPSWDALKVGEQAGLYPLADTPGVIMDGLTLGDYFMIYKTDSVWIVQFIGGEFTMSFRKLFGDEAGILGTDCVAEFDGKHFVLTATGAYVHNGQTKEEIMEQWVKDELFENVAADRIQETKIIADHNNKEIWIYYTTVGSTWCDRAIIWNWEIQKWTVRDLSGISYIAEGIVDKVIQSDQSWDGGTGTWADDVSEVWNSDTPPLSTDRNLLLADYTNKLFYRNEEGETMAGSPMVGRVKRIGIDFEDDANFKYLTRVIPHIKGQNPVDVTVYVSDTAETTPNVAQKSTFNPLVDHDVDCHVSGRYVGVEFSGDEFWVLTGYSLEWEPMGRY